MLLRSISSDVFERRIFRYGAGIRYHDLPHLATSFMHEVGRRPSRTDKKFEPPAAFSLSPDLGTSDKVALRDDADQRSGLIHHGKAADVFIQHDVGGIDHGSVGGDGDDLPCHDLVRAHLRSPDRD
jgi:hypothetical protein